MIKWLLFASLLTASSSLLLSQGCADAGEDIKVCGFNYTLAGNPGPGTWSYLCNADSQYVRMVTTNNRSVSATVEGCGIYRFVYTANDVKNSCFDTDTVTITFEDPSSGVLNVNYSFTLSYPVTDCHDANPDTCGNTRVIKGAEQPDPFWNMLVRGSCSTTNYTVRALNKDSTNCTANFIDIRNITSQDSSRRTWRSNQDVFINLNEDNTEIDNNIFLGFLDLLTNSLTRNLRDSCGTVSKCFELDASCSDTLYDTTQVFIPVHLGGHWNYVGQNGIINLSDSNHITIGQQEYILNISPSPRYYGPDDVTFEILKRNNDGSTSYIDTSIAIDVYWDEDWIYDTVQRILPRIELSDQCEDCGRNVEHYSDLIMPRIPSYFCQTLFIKFTADPPPSIPQDTVLCGDESILLDAGDFDTYLWNDGSTFRFKNVFDTGTFSVQVVNYNGCLDSATAVIHRSSLPLVEIVSLDSTYCVGDSFSLFANAPDSSLYFWSTGDSTQEIFLEANGTQPYYVEIQDSNGCRNTDTFLINVQHGMTPVYAGVDTSLNCIVQSIQLTPDTNNLRNFNQFEWGGPGIDSNNFNLLRPTIDLPGIYTLDVFDTIFSCRSRDTVLILSDTMAPTFQLNRRFDTLSCLFPVRTISLVNIISKDPYRVIWSNILGDTISVFDNEIEVDSAGIYIVQLCNRINGCCSTDTAFIHSTNRLIRADAGPDKILTCDSMSVKIGGSNTSLASDLFYIWNGPGFTNRDTTPQIVVNRPGTYTLVVRDSSGICQRMDEVIVTAPGTIPIAILGDDIHLSCEQPIDTIDGSASVLSSSITINWSGPSITNSNRRNISQTVEDAGIYVLILTDTLNGCVSRDTVSVTKNIRIPIIDAGFDKIITCKFASAKLDGRISNFRPSQVITWTGPGIQPGDEHISTPEVVLPGKFIFEVIDTLNNCRSVDSLEVIALLRYATVNAGPDQSLNCINNEISIKADISNLQAPGIFEWSGPGVTNQQKNDTTIIVFQEGTFVLRTEYPNSLCNQSDTVIITIDTLRPELKMPSELTLDCNGRTIAILATSRNKKDLKSINWRSNNPFVIGRDSLQIDVEIAGTYYLEIIGNNGCTSNDSTIIQEWDSFSFDLFTKPTCPSSNNGSVAVIDILGNKPPFVVSLDGTNYQTELLFKDLNAGRYIVYVKDAEDCILTDTADIALLPSMDWTVVQSASCDDSPTGSITISVSSGALPIRYEISSTTDTVVNNTGIFNDIYGNENYKIALRDSNGCEVTDQLFVDEVENFTTATFERIEYCNENTILLKAIEDDNYTTLHYDWGTNKDTLRTRIVRALSNVFEVRIFNACKTLNKTFELAPLSINADTALTVPLAFSPNQDGENDLFGPSLKLPEEQIILYEMRIYNRWGQEVFRTENPALLWDGQFKGEESPTEVYLYVINVKFDNCTQGISSISRKGDVTLIR